MAARKRTTTPSAVESDTETPESPSRARKAESGVITSEVVKALQKAIGAPETGKLSGFDSTLVKQELAPALVAGDGDKGVAVLRRYLHGQMGVRYDLSLKPIHPVAQPEKPDTHLIKYLQDRLGLRADGYIGVLTCDVLRDRVQEGKL